MKSSITIRRHTYFFAILLACTGIFSVISSPASAQESVSAISADAPIYAPAPEWVVDPGIPADTTEATSGEATSYRLLSYQDNVTEKGGTEYIRVAYQVNAASALNNNGTLSSSWVPGRQKMTINEAVIRRGDIVIDLLENGKKFEITRRERNLSSGIIDGVLTASLQIPDLRVGDIVDYSYMLETEYTPLIGHFEDQIDFYSGVTADRYHQSTRWPKKRQIFMQHGDKMPAGTTRTEGKYKIFEVLQDNMKVEDMPGHLPGRFGVAYASKLSTFESWGEVAEVFKPVYERASVVPATGELRDRVEAIRTSGKSKIEMAETALQMVQGDVRYVGNFAGLGNYTPEPAATVWGSRFGDCKGKTVLLIAILRELGIEAIPALVASQAWSGVESDLPMPSRFDHVITRAVIDGKVYWLDGTLTNQFDLATLPPPFMGYALPIKSDSAMEQLPEPRYPVAQREMIVEVDASAGWDTPAPYKVKLITRGQTAAAMLAVIENLSDTDKEEQIEMMKKASEEDDNITFTSFKYIERRDIGEGGFEMIGTREFDWGDASDLRELKLQELQLGTSFWSERDEEKYQEDPYWITAEYSVVRYKMILPKGDWKFDVDTDDIDVTIGPARFTRTAVIKDGVLTATSASNIATRELPFDKAKEYDERSDELFADTPFVYAYLDGKEPRPRTNRFAATIEDAEAMAGAGDLAGGLALIDARLAGAPQDTGLLLGRAKLVRETNTAMAERDIHRVLMIDSDNLEALRMGAEILTDAGYDDLAEKLVKRILDEEADDEWATAWTEDYEKRSAKAPVQADTSGDTETSPKDGDDIAERGADGEDTVDTPAD